MEEITEAIMNGQELGLTWHAFYNLYNLHKLPLEELSWIHKLYMNDEDAEIVYPYRRPQPQSPPF